VPQYVLAVDVGTQSTRAALVDADGQLFDLASSPVRLFAPAPGWAEQDPEDWWETTVSNIAAVTARNPGVVVRAVGVGAHMHGVVAVDAAGASLTERVAIWNDKRCLAQVTAFSERGDAESLSRLAANTALPAWAGFKMAWLARCQPAAYQGAAHLLVVKDFINLRLCGQVATDPTEASGSFLCDASTGNWSKALVAALGLDPAKLAPIVPPSSVIGGVLPAVASRCGLVAGTPVVAGCGDMMSQLLSLGLTEEGRVGLVAGTASIMAVAASRPSADPAVMNLCSASGNWIRFGIADAAGNALRWFADNFWVSPGATEVDFSALTEEAAQVPPGSAGLLFFPYLLGERTLGSPHSRASFVGATLEHTRAHFLRAVMEGICLEERRALESLGGRPSDEPIRCSGGGASSSTWSQMRADVLGRPVQALASTEGTLQGAAILAGVAAGWYPDATSGAEQVVDLGETWFPDTTAMAIYSHAYELFCRLHDSLGAHWERWPR
jgi:xylulokinase